MKLVIIAALSENGVIGRDGGLPWHLPADMKHFRRTTGHHPVVAGRKTYESFPRGPLPGRTNLVVTRSPDYDVPEGVVVCPSLEAAIDYCRTRNAERLFVLGGAQIYHLALPLTDEMILTHVPHQVQGDTFFPIWNREEWEVVDSREEEGLSFVIYRRKC